MRWSSYDRDSLDGSYKAIGEKILGALKSDTIEFICSEDEDVDMFTADNFILQYSKPFLSSYKRTLHKAFGVNKVGQNIPYVIGYYGIEGHNNYEVYIYRVEK